MPQYVGIDYLAEAMPSRSYTEKEEDVRYEDQLSSCCGSPVFREEKICTACMEKCEIVLD